MPEGNVELARRLVRAFNSRDLPTLTENFSSEIEWRPGGPAAVERAVYRGRDEVSEAFAATWEEWELFRLEESEVHDLKDLVVWVGHARLRGEASHVEFEQEFAIHVSVRDRDILRIQGFPAWQQALEAAGLSPGDR